MIRPFDRGSYKSVVGHRSQTNTFLSPMAQVSAITSTQTCVAQKASLPEYQPAVGNTYKASTMATLNAFPLILMTIFEIDAIGPFYRWGD